MVVTPQFDIFCRAESRNDRAIFLKTTKYIYIYIYTLIYIYIYIYIYIFTTISITCKICDGFYSRSIFVSATWEWLMQREIVSSSNTFVKFCTPN